MVAAADSIDVSIDRNLWTQEESVKFARQGDHLPIAFCVCWSGLKPQEAVPRRPMAAKALDIAIDAKLASEVSSLFTHCYQCQAPPCVSGWIGERVEGARLNLAEVHLVRYHRYP